jgi:hypothetical protein
MCGLALRSEGKETMMNSRSSHFIKNEKKSGGTLHSENKFGAVAAYSQLLRSIILVRILSVGREPRRFSLLS